MPSYEEVILSLEADGFAVVPGTLELIGVGDQCRCSQCSSLLEGTRALWFAVAEDPEHLRHICLNRIECRARANNIARGAQPNRQAVMDQLAQAGRDRVAASVILPDEETFPENHD